MTLAFLLGAVVGPLILWIVARVVERDYEYIADRVAPRLVEFAAFVVPSHLRRSRRLEWKAELEALTADYGLPPLTFAASLTAAALRLRALSATRVLVVCLPKRLRYWADSSTFQPAYNIQMVKLQLPLEESEPLGSESVWAESLADGTFRIDNHAFFTDEYCAGDVVSGKATDSPFVFEVGRIVLPTDELTLRVMGDFRLWTWLRHRVVAAKLHELGGYMENFQAGAFGLQLTPGPEALSGIELIERAGFDWEFVPGREACISCGELLPSEFEQQAHTSQHHSG